MKIEQIIKIKDKEIRLDEFEIKEGD